MGNNIYNMFNNQNNNPFEQIINEAQNLKRTFQGNPRQEVERLLQTGAMSQSDYNRYSSIARQVVDIIEKNKL